MKMEETVWVYNPQVEGIKELIKSAGNTIGSVHFMKRKDGSLRKMTYRLHVTNPSVAKAPIGVAEESKESGESNVGVEPVKGAVRADGSYSVVMQPKFTKGFGPPRKEIDQANNQMTVLDANKVVKDTAGEVIGRGAWRTIPLESVVQITVKGVKYVIKR